LARLGFLLSVCKKRIDVEQLNRAKRSFNHARKDDLTLKEQTPQIEVGPFKDCPDILSVKDLCQLLRIGRVGVYKLLGAGTIHSFKIGNIYKIPKDSLIAYMNKACNTEQKGDMYK
jgi:excisionase family DNA binding protein